MRDDDELRRRRVRRRRRHDDEYEYVADSSGLEAPSDTDLRIADSMSASRRRRYELEHRRGGDRPQVPLPHADADGRWRVLLLASAVAAFTWSSAMWWVCGSVGAVTLLYLGYLRRQTRIEERVRRRRAQRIARSRLGVENTDDRSSTSCRRGCADRARRCWRSTTRIPSSSTSTTRRSPGTTTCRGRQGSSRWRFRPVRRLTGSLLPVSGAMAQLVARLVRIE